MKHVREPALHHRAKPERAERRQRAAAARRCGSSTCFAWVTSSWWWASRCTSGHCCSPDKPWGLAEGTVECMLVAMSVLALLGLRYPQRMLPILLFEVAWKLIWLGVVAVPLWLDDKLAGATREQAGKVLLGGDHHRRRPVAPRVRPVRDGTRRAVASEPVSASRSGPGPASGFFSLLRADQRSARL